MTFPHERSSKEPVDGAHEFHDNTFLEGDHKALFLEGISGVVYEVIDVDAYVDWCGWI